MQRGKPGPWPRVSRGRLHDVICALTRVGIGWMFAEYGLSLRGHEAAVAEHLSGAGIPVATFVAPVLPILLVALSLAFAVGLLTWLTGPMLAGAAILGALAASSPDLAPFTSWATTVLVTAVCVLMSVEGGRWSWDYLVLSPRVHGRPRARRHKPSVARRKVHTVSPRRPEHAPPLLYPVGQVALRRPYQF